jgi:transcriptional regulator with XRE-family HTH domain
VDDARIGRSLRVLRRRRGLRQIDVAALAGLSQQTISLIERGQAAAFTVDTLRRALAAVGAGYEGLVVWRGGALDRLLDARHSALVGEAAARLTALGWAVVVEASYSIYGERGSVDVLAGHAATRTVLVEEVKSELASIEALGRKTDEKVRLARRHLCRERFGWPPIAAGRFWCSPTRMRRGGRSSGMAACSTSCFPAAQGRFGSGFAGQSATSAGSCSSRIPTRWVVTPVTAVVSRSEPGEHLCPKHEWRPRTPLK